MCYHVSTPSKKALKDQNPDKKVETSVGQLFHANGFGRPYLPVTLNNDQGHIIDARWKLIPFWVKNEQEAGKYANTLNAESESIFEKASYKHYIGKQRGLLYVDGFYEPHKVKGVKETENYYIYRPEHKIMTLGIVYSIFADQETGDTYPTFSVITTAANPLLAEIHNVKKRMPLIIPEDARYSWLNSQNPNEIKSLMKPYDYDLDSHQVYRVTGARDEDTNTPDIQLPLF